MKKGVQFAAAPRLESNRYVESRASLRAGEMPTGLGHMVFYRSGVKDPTIFHFQHNRATSSIVLDDELTDAP